MMNKFCRLSLTLLLLILSFVLSLHAASATTRDYLTPEEVEQVKLAQVIDQRIDVFIKAAERRLLVLGGAATSSKQTPKEQKIWGDLPKGTRVELIMDIANILDAAINNIDDVAVRDEKNRLIPKALRKLGEAATRIQMQLTVIREQTHDNSEHRAIEEALRNVAEIVGASSKLEPEVKKN